MASRDIKLLTPRMQEKYLEFDRKMKLAGLPYIVTSTARTILEQIALFLQGRMPLGTVNLVRHEAGLYLLSDQEQKIVTWTILSEHVTNMFDKDLDNDLSRAFDIALVMADKPHWDIKVSVNDNEIPDYTEAGVIGETCGLTWGGRFRKRDYVHFQDNKER